MRILLILTFLLLRVVSGQNSVIEPLVIGNEWRYIDSTFVNGSLSRIDTTKYAITESSTIEHENQQYTVFHRESIDPITNQPTGQKILLANQDSGLWEYGFIAGTDTLITRNHFLKYPAMPGDTTQVLVYSIADSIEVLDTLQVTCTSINEQFSTPGGNFTCHVYQYRYTVGSVTDYYNYYVPDLGLVGFRTVMAGELIRKRVLSSFNLVTQIATNNPNGPLSWQLHQNYPNPFNPVTKISYTLRKPAHVLIVVYDVFGREVRVLVNKSKNTGAHSLSFDGRELTSGVYFYQLQVDGKKLQTKKMVLLR